MSIAWIAFGKKSGRAEPPVMVDEEITGDWDFCFSMGL